MLWLFIKQWLTKEDRTHTVQFIIFRTIFSLFSMKSFLTASQAVCPPILIGIDFDWSKTKTWDVKRTTPHSQARSLKQHSVEASLHHAVKSLVRFDSRSYGASSQEGLPCTDLSLPHRKILRPNKIVLDDIDFRSPASLTFLHFDTLSDTCALMPLDLS